MRGWVHRIRAGAGDGKVGIRANHEEQALTVQEVSRYLRVHPSTIYKLLKKNQLPAFRVGSAWRFNIESLDRWCAEAAGHITSRRRGRS